MAARPRRRAVAAAGALLSAAALGAGEAVWDGAQLQLTDINFEAELEDRDLAVVLFYASWCGASKQMFPYFAQAAELMRKSGVDITFAKVDAEENQGAKGRAHAAPGGMTGYPTLKVSRNGVLDEWTGSASRVDGLAEKIVSHLMDLRRETVRKLTDAAAIKARFHRKRAGEMTEAAVVGYFGQMGLDYKVFRRVAGSLYGVVPFYAVTDKPALEKLGFLGSGSAVTLYRPWEGKGFKTVYNGVLMKNPLRDWLLKESFAPIPVVGKLDAEHFRESVRLRKARGTLVALVDAMRPDPNDTKPGDWDQPEEVEDPDATLPADWDEEEDGPWHPPTMKNPLYRGEWRPREVVDAGVVAELRAALEPLRAAHSPTLTFAIMDAKAPGPGADLAAELGFTEADYAPRPAAPSATPEETAARIAALDKEKLAAAEREDFERALELKQQIERLRAESAAGGGAALPTGAFAITEPGKRGKRFKHSGSPALADWVEKYMRRGLAPYSSSSLDALEL
eukprot:TRINITY_DN5657_c1_g2_i1.p1 TRINITY_DN5657_c1_g2~~TRINITY_DN5657_c1_g2_i1.p1  ORF type:complete len:530 (+),score=204.89 TRINITY_DN5657_c1_g2_i1:65-1591(+)